MSYVANNQLSMYQMSKHLKTQKLSYREHFGFAWNAGIVLIVAGLASLIHAVFPNVLATYSEKKTKALARLANIRHSNE